MMTKNSLKQQTKNLALLVCMASIFTIGCNNPSTNDVENTTENQDTMNNQLAKDPHSFASPNDVAITHMNINLNVDFDQKILSGYNELTLKRSNENAPLILDTKDLSVDSVTSNGEALSFQMGSHDEIFGSSLTVDLKENTEKVRVHYTTSPKAEALQWLSPSQTFGKKDPFLFSQSQAILARTWLPCQDGPGVKFTYNATITVPNHLMALMSAENGTEKTEDGVYTFTMDQPVSSYLMALTVGDLAFESTGRNSGVYAEPDMLEKSVWEFADMQSMIDSAEELYGPYQWGRYDVVVLPPSFPFGGMENPRLTFATPTIIAGDRSLVALIAHELAHSWSGNLVTNETWNDFWLNEGFTVYFEQRIMEKIYGMDYSEMQTKLGMGELKETIHRLTEEGNAKETHLYLELEGRNPDDGLTDVAYEKGRFFLQTVEAAVGREAMDEFLKNYFTENAFKPMNTERFIAYLNAHVLTTPELQAQVNADAWIYGPGLPENAPNPESTELDKVGSEIAAFNEGSKKASDLDTTNWTTHHWLYFLRGLQDMDIEKLTDLDGAFALSASGNSEILCDWFKHTIEAQYDPANDALAAFLKRVGRRKFLQPLYVRLAKTESGKAWAQEVYKEARPGYHAVSFNTIDVILDQGSQD
jgi:leukotriene A-4 hydrolase/aminopeptidase